MIMPHILIGQAGDDPGGVQQLRHTDGSRTDVFPTFEDDLDRYYMYRPGEVLVATADVKRVQALLDAADATMEDEDEVLDLQKWCLPRADGVRYLVARCRSSSEIRLPGVSANTVIQLGGHIRLPCASAPKPATALEPLTSPPGSGPGAGVRVGLIDTGVSDEHPWLTERSELRLGLDSEVASLAGIAKVDDAAGHGTFAAGLILRHAPGATLVVRRKVTGGGLIDDLALARAVLELGSVQGDEGVNLLHLSLGGFTADNIGLLATGRALRRVAQINPDIVVVASSGNDGVDRPHYPAAFKGVVGVGAFDAKKGEAASFSNHGQWVDACANGVDVVSTYFSGNLIPPMAESLTPQYFEGYASWSGSSHATAQVTGAIAAKMNPDDSSAPLSARQAVFELLTSGPGARVPTLGTRLA